MITKELIIGSIPDNFNPLNHIPISPICFVGREKIYPDFENLEYTDVLHEKENLVFLDKLTNDEALSLVNETAEYFNKENFQKFTFIFWKTLYYPWLQNIIPFLYRKQLLVSRIVEKYKQEEILVKFNKEYKSTIFTFSSIDDFLDNGIHNIFFNEMIITEMLHAVIPKKWIIEYYSSKINTTQTNKNYNKSRSIKIILNNLIDLIFYRSKMIYGFNQFDRMFLHILFMIKKPILSKKKININTPQPKIKWIIDIKELLFNVIPAEMKNIGLLNPPRKYKKGKVVNYAHNLYNKSRLDAAYAYEHGELVMATQHGGHLYGSAKTSESVYNIEFTSSLFASWGWNKYKEKKMDNIIPLPSPLLSRVFNKNKHESSNVIFIGTEMNPFVKRFDSFMSEVEILCYRKNKVKFIKLYKDSFGLNNFFYKPFYEKNYLLEDSVYLKRFFPELNFIYDKPKIFHKKLLECACLVMDHPGTTLNIALVMNVPLMLFWELDWYPFNEDSLEMLEQFKLVGVYNNNLDELINHHILIKNTYQNINEWWNQEKIQNIRYEWLQKFALVGKNWRKIWLQTLWNIK